MSRIMWKYLAMSLIAFALIFTFGCTPKSLEQKSAMKEEIVKEQAVKEEPALPSAEQEYIKRERLDAEKLVQEAKEKEKIKEEKERYSFVVEDIYFDFDSSILKLAAVETLRKKADWLLDRPYISITIEGHCDSRGTNAYNLALGEKRAESANKFLVDFGISPDRIKTISYGEEYPIALGNNEVAWAKNRRVHFSIKE